MVDLLADLEFLNEQPSGERVLALERIIPRDTVQEILQQTGHASRHCPRLPHWFMVFYVISLGLFCRDNYRQVYKWLQRFRPLGTPQRNTLAEARKGLGIPPLRYLAQRIVRLLCPPDTPGAFYKGLRLMALDGFVPGHSRWIRDFCSSFRSSSFLLTSPPPIVERSINGDWHPYRVLSCSSLACEVVPS